MKKTVLAAALAALLSAPGVSAAADGPTKRPMKLDLKVETLAGGADGFRVRPESGGVAVVRATANPALQGEGWRLEVPFRVAHRQTFGFDLQETTGGLDLEPWVQATKKLRLGLEAGVFGANRPNWPDLYQPNLDPVTNLPDGTVKPTDRYSYFAWRGGVQMYARPASRQHLRARYRFVSYDYRDDSAFTELDVMHITPRDRTQHEVDLSWRHVQTAWAFGLRLDYTHREYKTLLARIAGSGSTNADTTPLQKLDIYEPSAEVELKRIGGKLELSFRYGLDVQNDPFQGYYSYTGHHPRVQARLAITERLAGSASVEGLYITYGPDGSTRLDPGSTRRKDSRTSVEGEVEYRLSAGLSLHGEAGWTSRTTNFRDYVRTQSPSGFDVDFDYTNVVVLAGLVYRL